MKPGRVGGGDKIRRNARTPSQLFNYSVCITKKLLNVVVVVVVVAVVVVAAAAVRPLVRMTKACFNFCICLMYQASKRWGGEKTETETEKVIALAKSKQPFNGTPLLRLPLPVLPWPGSKHTRTAPVAGSNGAHPLAVSDKICSPDTSQRGREGPVLG